METIPFYIKREELTGRNLREADEDLLDQDLTFDDCRMTAEELKAEIMRSEKAFEDKLFISHEEMRKKHPRK